MDYFATYPMFPSQMEQLESCESGLDLNGGWFVYSLQSCQNRKQRFCEVNPLQCLWDRLFASFVLLFKFLRQVVKKPKRKDRAVFVFVFSLEVYTAPRKTVHSRKRNSELDLVLDSFFVLYVQVIAQTFLIHYTEIVPLALNTPERYEDRQT